MTERFARISEHAIRCRGLSAADWRALACISLHADDVGRAFPGMTTIAEMTGIRRQDVPRTIRRLVAFGLLRRDPGAGPNGVNVYTRLNIAEVSAMVRTVRNGADPQGCGGGVRNAATKVSATLRTKQTIEQTIEHIPARRASRTSAASSEIDEWFEQFWRLYPSRGGQANPKKPAREKFAAAVKRGIDPETLVRAADNYAEAMRRGATPGRFVKTAEVWLNKASWEQYAAAEEPEPLRAGMI